jgi:surface protein
MRKNRSNNGYIGKDSLTPYNGSMAPSNVHRNWSGQDTKGTLTGFNIPTDGGGYSASASVEMTAGELVAVHPLRYDTAGIAYSTTNRFRVTGGGGPTAFGLVTQTDGGGIFTLNLYHGVDSVTVSNAGVGYSSAPTVTFPAAGSTTLTASIAADVLTVTAATDTVTLRPGSEITATGVATNTVVIDYITGRGGTGTYLLNNSQTVTSRSMTGNASAKGVATISGGSVTGISMTNFGSYVINPAGGLNRPTITFSGGSPLIAASAFTNMQRYIGYTSAPTITFLNPPGGGGSTASGATAAALILYDIQSIGVSAGGQNYSSAPSVIVQGRGAERGTITAIATVSGGTVSQITAITGDVLFTSVPNVTIGGWRDLPNVSEGEDKVVGTYAIYDDDNYVAFIAGGTYDVDWGDGTTGTFNSGATATKIYSKSVFAGITQNPIDGYKTVTIIATPVSGSRFTTLNFNVRHPSLYPGGFGFNNLTSGWLNMKIAGNQLGTLTMGSVTVQVTHRMLERFEFVGAPRSGGSLTDTSYMFNGCISLVEFIGPRLTENCTNISNMFSGCVSLKRVSEMATENVTNMTNLFNNCSSLYEAPKMNTSKVAAMNFLFSGCASLKEVPLYDTSNVTTMQSMFANCRILQTIPQFNTSKCTTFESTFSGCRSLESIPHLDTSAATSMFQMFQSCSSLRTIPKFKTSKVTTMESMFSGCFSLEEIPLLETENVIIASSMFSSCHKLRTIPPLDTRSVTTATSMFANSGIREIPEMNFLSVTTAGSMFQSTPLTKCPQLNMPLITTASSMFSGCSQLKEIGNINMPRLSNCSSMFSSCQSLEYPPEIIKVAYQLTTSPSIDMSLMFSSCGRLKRAPLFTTTTKPPSSASTTTYTQMFNGCASLSEIPEYDFIGASGSANTGALSLIFGTCYNIRRVRAINFCQSFSLPNPNMMGATALNELYTNLAVVGASGAGAKTLTVTGSLGTAGDNPAIATAKGWTITG